MPYAFLNPDGTIKMVVPKPTPFMRDIRPISNLDK